MSKTVEKAMAVPGKPMRWTMRDGRTGAIVTVTEAVGTKSTMFASDPKAMLSQGQYRLLLKALDGAKLRSRESGKPLQFVVEVEPDGSHRIVSPDAVASTPSVAAPELEADETETADLERALGAARERGRHRVAEILARTEMLSADEFARHLNSTRATINIWRTRHKVLGLAGATRGYRYPSWQIGQNGQPFEALPRLFALLGDSPWAVYRLLVQTHDELDGLTGHAALKRGQDEQVVRIAESVAEGAFA